MYMSDQRRNQCDCRIRSEEHGCCITQRKRRVQDEKLFVEILIKGGGHSKNARLSQSRGLQGSIVTRSSPIVEKKASGIGGLDRWNRETCAASQLRIEEGRGSRICKGYVTRVMQCAFPPSHVMIRCLLMSRLMSR